VTVTNAMKHEAKLLRRIWTGVQQMTFYRSLTVTANCTIRQITYHFILQLPSRIWYRFQNGIHSLYIMIIIICDFKIIVYNRRSDITSYHFT